MEFQDLFSNQDPKRVYGDIRLKNKFKKIPKLFETYFQFDSSNVAQNALLNAAQKRLFLAKKHLTSYKDDRFLMAENTQANFEGFSLDAKFKTNYTDGILLDANNLTNDETEKSLAAKHLSNDESSSN